MATDQPVSNDFNEVRENWSNWTNDEWASFVRDNVRFTQSQVVVQEQSIQLSNDAENIQTTGTEHSDKLNEFGNVSKLYVTMTIDDEPQTMMSVVNGKVFDADSLIRMTKRGFVSTLKEFGLQFDRSSLTPEILKTIIDQYYEGTVLEPDEANFGFLTFPAVSDYLLSDFGLDKPDKLNQPIKITDLNRINNTRGFGDAGEPILLKEVLKTYGYTALSEQLLKSKLNNRDVMGRQSFNDIMAKLDTFVDKDGFQPIALSSRYQLETDADPDNEGMISIRLTDRKTKTPVENGKIYTWYGAQGDLQSVTDSDELYNLTMSRLGELRIKPTIIADWQQSTEMPDAAKQFIARMRNLKPFSTNDSDYLLLPEVVNDIPTEAFIQQMEEFDDGITDELAGETFGVKNGDGTFAVYHVVGGDDAYFVEEYQNEIVAKLDIATGKGEYSAFDDPELLSDTDKIASDLISKGVITADELNDQTVSEFTEFVTKSVDFDERLNVFHSTSFEQNNSKNPEL